MIQEFSASLYMSKNGLFMYAGVIPHLIKTESVLESIPGVSPFAFGYSLYLALDHLDLPTRTP